MSLAEKKLAQKGVSAPSPHERIARVADSLGLDYIKPSEGRAYLYHLYRFRDCGHTQEISNDDLREDTFECKECRNIKLATKASDVGLELTIDGLGIKKYRFKICGHTQYISDEKVIAGDFRCSACLENRIRSDSSNHPIVSAALYTAVMDAFGDNKKSVIQNIDRKLEYQRRVHAKLTAEAKSRRLIIIGPGSDYAFRIYKFRKCGHTQEIRTSAVRIGSFRCSQCEESHLDKPSELYVLLVQAPRHGGPFLKIGKGVPGGHRVIQQDRASDDDVEITQIATVYFDTGRECLKVEKALHASAKSKGIRPFVSGAPSWYPDGGTELWLDTPDARKILSDAGIALRKNST